MSNPDEQEPFTFGNTPAAIRLKVEMDNGAKSNPTISMLSKGQERLNELINATLLPSRYYFTLLLRKEVVARIAGSGADPIIRSLARNVFVTNCKLALKGFQKKSGHASIKKT